MGINSTEVSYGFGQLGSAYTDKAVEIIPPKDHVIVGIQFLADNTPTVMLPERLDQFGPGYVGITGTTAATVLDFEETATQSVNFAGAFGSRVVDNTYPANTNISLTDAPTTGTGQRLLREGMIAMTVDDGATENGSTAMQYDVANGTPLPIYNGPYKAGTKVTNVNGAKIKLDTEITVSGEALIFIDEHHGAGGITAAGQVFPKGVTIYGRWTAFKGEADKGVICYFGK
jgi:hypothetical protein